MDFYRIVESEIKKGVFSVYPDFKIGMPSDFMTRGKAFYAIWDESTGLWSTDETRVQEIIDNDINQYIAEQQKSRTGTFIPRYMSNFSSKLWQTYRQYVAALPDNARQLDVALTFQNSQTKKEDYRSKRLLYSFEPGECNAFNTLMSRLYSKEEREKIEWCIGAIVAGESKDIQKFLVLYGDPGSGKGTVIKIIEKLFQGYYSVFDARSLGNSSNTFAMEGFKSNPLVAIQHDGDLSRIEDNTRLNSIVSHEIMQMNEKFKSAYPIKLNSFLFIGTNKPVKITDAKSGVIRRLIDVTPTGKKFSSDEYNKLMSDINYELGQIAWHCFGIYQERGKHYYDGYKPIGMMFKTDVFYNFVEDSFDVFKTQNGVTLTQAYEMYKVYCNDCAVEFVLPKYKFREELKNYFRSYEDSANVDGRAVRGYYSGFLKDKFVQTMTHEEKKETINWLSMVESPSLLDDELGSYPAQYANSNETPEKKWEKISTVLNDLDTSRLHYVKPPLNHIVIDFDLKDEEGNKSQELNLKAASEWPETYAELSKGGNGIHLHYIYNGDPTKLKPLYKDGIEIKVFTGNSALRRRLSKCNNLPVANISSGLPMKEGKKMFNMEVIKDERVLRKLIVKNLKKEIHPGTKPSVEFIQKILQDAYDSGTPYDLTDMRQDVMVFANNSTHHADYCLKLVDKMKFKSAEKSENATGNEEDPLVFFDCEVFPNLFLINWKYEGEDKPIVRMINPEPNAVEELFHYKLVGFNNRKYDNHILYARSLGYTNEQLYNLSQKIINEGTGFFGAAYNLSYTDIYDFASAGNKKGLKKWEIELGIHHQELGLPWDQPVPDDKIIEVSEYCDNDVIASEKVFHHLKGDWIARQILAELSGLTVNDTTNSHSAKIIFGDNKNPQNEFVYTDLSKDFPGYVFENGKSTYMDTEIGEGGYVYAEPGIYYHVGLFDVESMHPSSIEALNLFGDRYTKRFSELKQGRLAIKHQNYDPLTYLLDGKLKSFVERHDFSPKDLSNALKTVINSVYGLTSAKFDNPFRDKRNIDNIVAKRGALFMRWLQNVVQSVEYTVAHIKTDSIKIPNYNDDVKEMIMGAGKEFGYNFEHEATYERMCLVNDAVYIAKYEDGPHAGEWTATGAQFAHPYVFKTLFSKEPIEFTDLCETKNVSKGAIYIDYNNDPEHMDLRFIGRTGLFCPIKDNGDTMNGGTLYRVQDGKTYAVTGTKGYKWLEAETVKTLGLENLIDYSYFDRLVQEAYDTIAKFGDPDEFINGDVPPWMMPCTRESCENCPHFVESGFHLKCELGYTVDESLQKKI